MVNGFLYSNKHNYAALYSSKAGCSSVRNLFMDLHKEELSEQNRTKYSKHDIKSFFPMKPDIKLDDIPKFLVIRNPYLRVVSMFTNKFIGENSMLKKKFEKYNAVTRDNTFMSFLNSLKDLKDRNVLNRVEYHISEQSYKTDFSLTSKIQIIDLDNFDEEILKFYAKYFKNTELYNKVKDIVFKSSNLLHSNTTKRTNLYENKDASKIEFNDILNIPPYKSFYIDPKVKELVDYIYASDFKKFGYKMVLPF
jgi:hypothetical protein